VVRIMNTPPANFGIPTLVAANAPPLTPKTSGDTSGSFALEISSRWQCNPAPEPLLKAGAPMDVGKQQADPQKQAKSVTSSGFPYPFLMQGVAVTNEPRNAPSGEPSGTPNASASTRSGTGEALPTDSQGTSAREITLSWGTAGIASAAFGLRLPISAGSVASTQTTGIPASPFSLSSNFSQISHKVEPAGVITPPVAEQTNPVGLPVVEERGHSLLGTASSAVNVTNQTSSPDTQQDAKAVAVASSPAAGQTEQVGRWQVQDAASLGANAILNPAAQLNLTDRPETYWAHGQPAAAFPATTGETKNAALPAALHDLVVQVLARQPQVPRGGAGESNPQSKSGQTVSANLPVAGTSLDSLVPGAPSAAGVFATPSESSLHELVSQILARQPQVVGDGVGESNPQPKFGQTVSANPPVAGTSLDSLVPGAPSAAGILATPSTSSLHELVTQILARQPQVVGDGVGESNPQPKFGQTVSANPPVAGTSLDSLVPGAPSAAGVFATPSTSSLHELVTQILARQPQVVGDGVGESDPQPKSSQTVSANPPVAGTSLDSLIPGAPSAAGILATPSESSLHELVSQILARQPQALGDGVGRSNPQPKSGQTVSANPPVAGTSLDSLIPGAPSAAGVFATQGESSLHELVSQILARQPQVVGDGVGESNPQPKFGQTVSANPPVAGTSLDSLVPGAPSAAGILATPSTSSLHELVTQILARQPQVVGDGVGESDPQPKSSQTVSANPPVAGTSLDSLIPGAPSAAGILATPSESSLHELVSQILARQPQALGDGVGQSNPQPKSGQTVSANPPVAGTSLDSLVPGAPSEARILVTQPESFLGKPQTGDAINLAHDAGQDKDGNTAVTAGASGTEGNPRSPGSSRGVTVTVPSPSSNPQLRSPASDKSKESDRVGSSPSSKEGTPRTDRTAGAVPDWTQAGGDTDAAADGSSPGGQTASATDRSPVSLKIASLVSAGQKVVAAEPDTGPGIAIDPSQAMRRGSDAQRDSATTSTESAGRAAPPALQNWDAIRQQLGQIVSSAHLAEAMGQSELQVDMKSDSLGPVSVRAILNNGQIGAEIQVSNHDARAVLTEGLHTLEKTLGEKGLQVVNLDVSQGLDYSHAQSQGQQGKQAGQAAHAAKGYTDHSVSKPELSEVSNTANWTGDFVLGRVSVHA